MKLSSAINSKCKSMRIGTIFCCIILLFLYQNNQNLKISATKNTIIVFTPLNQTKKSPISSMILAPPKPSILSTFTPPPPYLNPINRVRVANPNVSVYKPGKDNVGENKKCDMFDGKWVYKPEEFGKYDHIKCPFIEEKMSCRKNGRPDLDYEKWRWEPNHCHIPLFNGREMLKRLRNKRVIIVGDSLNRNMWESLSCLLYTSVPRSRRMRIQVHSKFRDYKVLKAKDYNTTVEFHWSPLLIKFDENHKSGKKVLVLDKLSSNSKLWKGADVMVFNSGHWWTHKGKFRTWDLFQYKGQLMEKMATHRAYDKGMKTWAKWIQENVDPVKTTVFFRSISTNHNVGKGWCYNSTRPVTDELYENAFPKLMANVIESLITKMNKPKVNYLNITKLSKYRNDAHPSIYRNKKWKIFPTQYADCSHWCLPGLPDTWNRLLYASLFFT
ncbi:protein trichome birefringence-like 40 isoform X2 [Spinacia oleracea]|uniref:Protein trichome birefringence-like 40 isoform X2 n=1 Tax=Spinacia oleracea TaxID=3562 RepID=A0A9R0JPP5_SPIOL|nr:protein trichome birefringence-like 40 isoform X2 [Spinacia oleracea]